MRTDNLGDPIDFKARQRIAEERKKRAAGEVPSHADTISEMNRTLAVLSEPVGTILVDGGTTGFQLATPRDLGIKYANKPNAPRGGWVSAWLADPGRREFSRIVFKPGEVADAGGCYNLWRGWGVSPSTNGLGISLFWDFVRDVICAKDKSRYVFLRKWMGHAIQRPGELPRVALLLHSIQGTGKGTLLSWFSALFGRNYFEASSLDNVLGHFNSHLANAMLVFANEAIWGGDKRQLGRLKASITDPTSDITQKYKDTVTVGNFTRWIFASNAEHPVAIERSDRRFVVFEIAETRKGDFAFFDRLEKLRVSGGTQALMRDLLAEDITGFNPERDMPTDGRAVYKVQSALPFEQWLQGCLGDAEIRRRDKNHDCYTPWDGYVPKNLIYDSYCEFVRSAKSPADSDTAFWLKMRSIRVVVNRSKRTGSSGSRPRSACLRDIIDARQAFAEYMTETVESLWPDPCDLPEPCPECAQIEQKDAEDSAYGRRFRS